MGILDRMMDQVTGDSNSDPRPKVLVRHYKDEASYAKDAERMMAIGYVAQDTAHKDGKANVGRTLGKAVVFLPWAILRPSRQGDKVTVTWVRQ